MCNRPSHATCRRVIFTYLDCAYEGCCRGSTSGLPVGPTGHETGFRGSGLLSEAAQSVTRGRRFSAAIHFRGKGGSVVGFPPLVTFWKLGSSVD
ncbi:hypothetical protein NDU88_005178 [Pleurodeles waltl]|uniref:Uncharacterized protein n=1 Tax=Pleurodeles waltl TaxID=8319 RepID=A0AAV7NPH4_PLEWA|nr:hypothetical protein NDU88_005178 [Pleurodeles waltl]